MKNRLADLNDHLFAQLERLGDETFVDDKLFEEIKRSNAIASLSTELMKIAVLRLEAAKLVAEYGQGDPTQYLPEPPRTVTVEL